MVESNYSVLGVYYELVGRKKITSSPSLRVGSGIHHVLLLLRLLPKMTASREKTALNEKDRIERAASLR